MKWIVRADCRPPKELDEPGQDGVHPRRHGQAGQDHQWQQHADHADIGQFLQRIVVTRLLAMRKFKPQMIDEIA